MRAKEQTNGTKWPIQQEAKKPVASRDTRQGRQQRQRRRMCWDVVTIIMGILYGHLEEEDEQEQEKVE